MTDLALQNIAALEATVRLAATGDEAAFGTLVSEHHAAMARVVFVICGDPDTTRDAVQNAWSIAWRRLNTLRDPMQVRPWLIAIAANEARQGIRRQQRHRVVDLSDAMDHNVGGDPADTIDLVDLRRALAHLTPEDRSLLALRFVAGLDSSEIARHSGLSASGVRSRLARLIARLRMDIDHA
jgi:RNA polymerase sigma-70 factor, ECF subfamily